MAKKPASEAPADENPFGYCKPPVHSRFSKGTSGNPAGRRLKKAKRNGLLEDVKAFAAATIPTSKGGKIGRTTNQAALVHRVWMAAMTGHAPSARLFMDMLSEASVSEELDAPAAMLSGQDIAILKRYVKRLEGDEGANP